MKLILTLFDKAILSHQVQTDKMQQVFMEFDRIPHQDFDALAERLRKEVVEAEFGDPQKGVMIQLEAYQIANLMKNAGHVGSEVPESNALLKVIR